MKCDVEWFRLQDQQPEKFEGLSKMEEVFARPADANFKAYFNLLFNGAYKSLDQEGDERLLKKVKQVFSSDLFTVICECVNGASAEPYAVVCHGDCWNNNIMYKYDKVISSIVLSFEFYFIPCPIARTRNRSICVSSTGKCPGMRLRLPILSTIFSVAQRSHFAINTTMT